MLYKKLDLKMLGKKVATFSKQDLSLYFLIFLLLNHSLHEGPLFSQTKTCLVGLYFVLINNLIVLIKRAFLTVFSVWKCSAQNFFTSIYFLHLSCLWETAKIVMSLSAMTFSLKRSKKGSLPPTNHYGRHILAWLYFWQNI